MFFISINSSQIVDKPEYCFAQASYTSSHPPGSCSSKSTYTAWKGLGELLRSMSVTVVRHHACWRGQCLPWLMGVEVLVNSTLPEHLIHHDRHQDARHQHRQAPSRSYISNVPDSFDHLLDEELQHLNQDQYISYQQIKHMWGNIFQNDQVFKSPYGKKLISIFSIRTSSEAREHLNVPDSFDHQIQDQIQHR